MLWHEMTGFDWVIIESLLSNGPQGVPRVYDRRVLNTILDQAQDKNV